MISLSRQWDAPPSSNARSCRRLHFRCHTGHAYSVQSLLAEMAETTEESVWSAVRSIEEHAMLMRRLADAGGVGGYGAFLICTSKDLVTSCAERSCVRASRTFTLTGPSSYWHVKGMLATC